MTYLELIFLIQEREEKIVADRSSSIQTDKHLYSRLPDFSWEERELSTDIPQNKLTLAPPTPPKEKVSKTKK